MRYQPVSNNILNASAEALINPVNCVGVMGAGLALSFKQRFPLMFEDYAAACRRRELQPGGIHVYDRREREGYLGRDGRYILNLASKNHYRDPSQLTWVRDGIRRLNDVAKQYEIADVAIPMLGAGLGGLDPQLVHAELAIGLKDASFDFAIYDMVASKDLDRIVARRQHEQDPRVAVFYVDGLPDRALILRESVYDKYRDELQQMTALRREPRIRYFSDVDVLRALDTSRTRSLENVQPIRSLDLLRDLVRTASLGQSSTVSQPLHEEAAHTLTLPAPLPRVLVLDDRRTFVDARLDLVHVRTNEEVIKLLESEPFDQVWLDYDLSKTDRRYPESILTARWLAEHPSPERRVETITDLPTGASVIRQLIPDVTIGERGMAWDKAHSDIDYDFHAFLSIVERGGVGSMSQSEKPVNTAAAKSNNGKSLSVEQAAMVVQALHLLADEMRGSYFYGQIQDVAHANGGERFDDVSERAAIERLKLAFPQLANATDLSDVNRFDLAEKTTMFAEEFARAYGLSSEHLVQPPGQRDKDITAFVNTAQNDINRDGWPPQFVDLSKASFERGVVLAVRYDLGLIAVRDKSCGDFTVVDIRNSQHLFEGHDAFSYAAGNAVRITDNRLAHADRSRGLQDEVAISR